MLYNRMEYYEDASGAAEHFKSWNILKLNMSLFEPAGQAVSNYFIEMSFANKNSLNKSKSSVTTSFLKQWKTLQKSLNLLFHERIVVQLDVLHEQVEYLMRCNDGVPILDHYRKTILKTGMIVLRFKVQDLQGEELLATLAETWNYFYGFILPQLASIFLPLYCNSQLKNSVHDVADINKITLLGFRDQVLLKSSIEDSIKVGQSISPAVKQMLLVLSSVEPNCPTKNYLRLESIIVKVIRPFFSYYNGYYGRFSSDEISSGCTESDNSSTCDRQKKYVEANNNNGKENISLLSSDPPTELVSMSLTSSYLNDINNRWQQLEELRNLESLSISM